jgi:hypothetical protein
MTHIGGCLEHVEMIHFLYNREIPRNLLFVISQNSDGEGNNDILYNIFSWSLLKGNSVGFFFSY